jgi:16S rRNA A1518/A1519 N6-dimethyltransferase RsmA/KsgA/DIM1 with predicted DNA glycosylase/AP lyase activity
MSRDMMFLIELIAIVCALTFGLVLLVGAPYVPTLRKQIGTALDLLDLQPGETLLEIGSGDGRVMRAAAQRGLNVVGIELNPLLVVVSWLVTFRYRKQVRVIWGSCWNVSWPKADGIFTFMLPRYMTQLDTYIVKWQKKPVRLASFAFVMPVRKRIAERDGIFLYDYATNKHQ